jgi:hypothetical protein
MKYITLPIDEKILALGMKYAKKHNISFNALVIKLLRQTIQSENKNWFEKFFKIMDKLKSSSNGRKWTRDEIHERR